MGAERERVDGFGRLEDGLLQAGEWYRWGPYVSERQWGTVREDYSADGSAWESLPHDHARSRAYRWGEDGLGGISDDKGLGENLFHPGIGLEGLALHDADRGRAYFGEIMNACSAMMQAIVQLPKPVVAAVQGIATAAGCQLVAQCDLAIASDNATFAVSGINVGLFCSTPAKRIRSSRRYGTTYRKRRGRKTSSTR